MENSVLKDVKFNGKFGLKGVSSKESGHKIFDTLTWENVSEEQDWTLAEWASVHPLRADRKQVKEGDRIDFSTESKVVSLWPGKGKLSFFADTSKEYGAPRKSGEDWIHLLLEQKIEAGDRVYLGDMKALDLALDYSVDECENLMRREEYDPNLHAAQISWFFTVENNRDTKLDFEGRPDYLWFGLPLFDNRHAVIDGPQIFLDRGTEKVIYSVKRAEYMEEPFRIGHKYCVRMDILPSIKKAFAVAKEQDWLKGARWEDMAIGSTNLGWEIPGTFRCRCTFENLSLTFR